MLGQHLAFFLFLSLAIVTMSAFYSEPEDGPALRSLPKRYALFVGACVCVAAIMLVLEWFFASAHA